MRILALVFALTAALPAQAQVADPMRPPDAAAAPAAGGAAAPGTAGGSGVQAVFLRQGARPAALINGEYVTQGGKLGDRRVLKITETEVVLRDAAGQKETLKVVAGVEKKPVAGKATLKKQRRDAAIDGDKDK